MFMATPMGGTSNKIIYFKIPINWIDMKRRNPSCWNLHSHSKKRLGIADLYLASRHATPMETDLKVGNVVEIVGNLPNYRHGTITSITASWIYVMLESGVIYPFRPDEIKGGTNE